MSMLLGKTNGPGPNHDYGVRTLYKNVICTHSLKELSQGVYSHYLPSTENHINLFSTCVH